MNKTNILPFSIISLLFTVFSCEYNETDILRNNRISEITAYRIDYIKTIRHQKKGLYIDLFDKTGKVVKRVDYHNPKRILRVFKYDSLGFLIAEFPYYPNNPNIPLIGNQYSYDKYGNFLHMTRRNHSIKNNIYYNGDNKLKILMIYRQDGNYKKIIAYYYNWLGYMNKKIELNFNGKKIDRAKKYEYKYSFWGKLLQEKLFSCYVNRKPVFENGNLLVNRYNTKYKLKETHKYTYYGNGLLKSKEKYANKRYI